MSNTDIVPRFYAAELIDFVRRGRASQRAIDRVLSAWRGSSAWGRIFAQADEHLHRWEDDGGGPR